MPDNNIHEKIGQLIGKVDGINKRLDVLNSSVKINSGKIQKHEVLLGKAGIIFVGVVFLVTTAITFVMDWLKSNIFNK